ncbi:MAG: 16S rRNA (adenine(1518)-N(6)/adenine(1519)-N(6))-dimethyltransferase RsmA [Clostridia bacterium]|jgi:16S rRNA (adenine1518-N6/adenine1519-N6)-dimethyltransferase|nr:16S rRNA (adenine(1518)-N(6)/adenine(1519)-N(6))-dimethyltransferase RsmA [Clostridia bacterium]MDD4275499.1 16S rRNA (adenine(1518)-N(6)/adenine(1519)-N(6))-dimethyltransferase RsmA [Clostridia bacterium]
MNNAKDLINEHSFSKSLGQNFITDTNLLEAIVSDAKINPNDCVLEIGAGAGTLTEVLCNNAKMVISYEIDKTLETILNQKLNKYKNLEIIYKDVLKENNQAIYKKFNEPYKIVANLPYYITTPLIFKFLEDINNVNTIVVMVQKEVAERIVAKSNTKEYGILSAIVQFYATAKIKRIVNKDMFYPRPNVDSAIVALTKNSNYEKMTNPKIYSMCVHSAFAMRRKTLQNNLCMGLKISKSLAKEIITDCGLPENIRGEVLTVENFIKLANVVIQKKIV